MSGRRLDSLWSAEVPAIKIKREASGSGQKKSLGIELEV